MEANRRNIPIKLGDFSVIDTEFSSIRERFDAEMRKMEDEMAKFRSELLNREGNFFESSSSTTQSTGNSSLSQRQQQRTSTQESFSSNANNSTSNISSPLIQGDGDDKVLKLRFDVSQYAPEEIVVKTVDNKLLVHAKHEEKSETKSVYRE